MIFHKLLWTCLLSLLNLIVPSAYLFVHNVEGAANDEPADLAGAAGAYLVELAVSQHHALVLVVDLPGRASSAKGRNGWRKCHECEKCDQGSMLWIDIDIWLNTEV